MDALRTSLAFGSGGYACAAAGVRGAPASGGRCAWFLSGGRLSGARSQRHRMSTGWRASRSARSTRRSSRETRQKIASMKAAILLGQGERQPARSSGSCLTDGAREIAHLAAAGAVTMFGVPGFFQPHFLPTLMAQPGSASATSLYDSSPLIATLERARRLGSAERRPCTALGRRCRCRERQFRLFRHARIKPHRVRIDHRHIIASGALPPGLPAIPIDGRHYWDGGLVSNTPLAHVLDHQAWRHADLSRSTCFPPKDRCRLS
jgi:hypothetical protein